jgi:glycosyltransferase involved in cell wall biosynthesis
MEEINDMESLLTIALPTYNRPIPLRRTLEALLPQVVNEPRARLLIMDNQSQVPVTQILKEMGVEQSDRLRVIRHDYNIGGNANLMRCVECCQTEWLWAVCDDDRPRPDAVSTILADTSGGHVFAFYAYSGAALPKRIPNGRLTGKTVEGLFEAIDYTFRPLTFWSACVLRTDAIRPWMSKGYGYLSSGIPLLSMVFPALAAGGEWLLSEKTICDYMPPPPDQAWPTHGVFLSLPIAYLVFQQHAHVRGFRRCLEVAHGGCPEFLLIGFINGYRMQSFFSLQCAYFFRIMKAYYAPNGLRHPLLWLKWQTLAVASFFPGPFSWGVRLVCRAIGRRVPCPGWQDRMD